MQICSTEHRGAGSGPCLRTSLDDVIDPVQPQKADEDQIDGDCHAHDPRRDQQEHSRDHGGDRQEVLNTGGVHRGGL